MLRTALKRSWDDAKWAFMDDVRSSIRRVRDWYDPPPLRRMITLQEIFTPEFRKKLDAQFEAIQNEPSPLFEKFYRGKDEEKD